MTNEPVVVMSGISPMYTSCSLTSLIVGLDASRSMITSRTLARSGEAYVRPRWWHSLTSNGGSPRLKPPYSSRARPLCEEIGKIDMNAACRPSVLRCVDGVEACRNWLYDSSCVASRNGTDCTAGRLAKLLRMRFFSVNEYGMDAPFGKVDKS